MHPASIFAGVAFRSALLFLIVFAVVIGVAGYATLRVTQATMEAQIRSSITEDVELLHDANTVGGERELIRFIHDSLSTRSDKQFAFGLFKVNGRRLAGNVADVPRFRGWGVIDREIGQTGPGRFVGYAEVLDDNVIVVGRSTAFLMAISETILWALLIGGVVIVAAALVIGYVLSRSVTNKLDVIDRTLEEVSRGNSDVRLPVGRSNDQIDHVSRQINAHLDRLSEFMGSMRNTIVAIAHDLKSPLHRAYLLLQDAGSDAPTQTSAVLLERATAEMETLGGILDTVLRISRIESSDDSSSFAAFAPAPLLRDLAQTFEPVAEAAGQRLVCDGFDAEVPPIFGDRKMVAQMLVNLIENASRYAGPDANIQLRIGTEAGAAVITVADTGPGIPAELRDEVFRPFHRLNAERNLPGAGLGLALVKAIAARHHAVIELSDNRPGLKVRLAFPAVRVPAREANLTPKYSSREGSAKAAP